MILKIDIPDELANRVIHQALICGMERELAAVELIEIGVEAVNERMWPTSPMSEDAPLNRKGTTK